jgi:hypothetical protein
LLAFEVGWEDVEAKVDKAEVLVEQQGVDKKVVGDEAMQMHEHPFNIAVLQG